MKKQQKLLLEYIKLVLKEVDDTGGMPARRIGPLGMPPAIPQQGQSLPRPIPAPPPKAFGLTQTSGPVTPQIAKILFRMFAAKLKAKGIDPAAAKQLGTPGTQGVAYDVGGGKVLKITGDVREAKSATILAGKTLPNVIQHYDAWQFPGTEFYGVLLEKLNPLTPEEAQRLNDALINTKFTLFLYKAGGDWSKGMQAMAQNLFREYVEQAYKQFPDAKSAQGIKDQRVQNFIRPKVNKTLQDFEALNKEFKLRDLFKSLKQLGIEYYDFHAGNYGRRSDGSLVLFDLGNGRVKGAGQIPMLAEEALRKVVLSVL